MDIPGFGGKKVQYPSSSFPFIERKEKGRASSFFVFDLLVSLKDSFSREGVVSLVRTIFFEYPFSKPPYSNVGLTLYYYISIVLFDPSLDLVHGLSLLKGMCSSFLTKSLPA